MKKQIFTKLFALFLVGGLLTTVGCKDYDDDIDALNKDVSDLKGEVVKINDLDARIAAVKATADAADAAFKAINFDQYVTDAELKTKLDQLVKDEQAHLATVLAGYATSQQLADAKTALENSIKAKTTLAEAQAAIMAKVAEELKKYAEKDASYTKAQIDKMLKDLKAEIIAQFPVVDNTANLWLGSDFGKYLKSFTSEAAFKTAIGGVASNAVLADLKNANSAFTAALNAIFTDKLTAFEDANGNKVIRKADLDTALEKYDTAIANLWSAVGNLAGRIQSLVYVPKAAPSDMIFFQGYALGEGASAPKLTENVSAEMAFRVSPASLAESLVKGYKAGTVEMSFIPEEVRFMLMNRAEEPEVVEIKSVDYDPMAPGKIMIRAISRYDYRAAMSGHEDMPKTLSIALCIKDSKLVGDKEDIETGIEFNSAYVPTVGWYKSVLSGFVQAKAKTDGTFTEYTGRGYVGYKLEYNDLVTKVELMKDYPLMYKDGAEYLTLAEAQAKFHWDVTPELVFAHATASNKSGKDQLVVTPADPIKDAKAKATPVVIKNNTIDKVSADNIGAAYLLSTNVSLKVGEEKIAMATPQFSSTLFLTRKALADIDLGTQTMTWNYAKFSAAGDAADYATAEITLKAGVLTAAQFEALDLFRDWDLTANKGSIAVDGITVVGQKISKPSTDTDAQIIKFTVQGYTLGDLNIKIAKSINVGAGEAINISGTIVINGLPKEVAAYDVSKDLTYAGEWRDLPVSKSDMVAALEKLINTNKFFAAGEFATAFAALGSDAPRLTSAQVTLDGEAKAKAQLVLKPDHSAVWANFASANFVKQPMLTYTVDGAKNYMTFLGVKIPLTGTITFKGSAHKLKAGGNLYDENTNPYSVVYGRVNGNAFALNAIKLSDSYTAAGDGLAVEYKVNKATEFTGVMPTISNGVIMAWGDCGLAKVSVTALLRYNAVIVDRKDFEVRLVQPVNYDSFGARIVDGKPVSNEVKVIPNEIPASMNVYSLMSMVDRQATPAQIFTADGISTLASQATGYGMTVTFGEPVFAPANVDFSRIHFNTTTGVFTVDQNQSALAQIVTATVKVTMTDNYTNQLNAAGENIEPTKIVKSVVVKFVPATK